MAKNKFTRMIETARNHQATEEPRIHRRAPGTGTVPPRKTGRPARGKRSDPDYESTTVFLRRSTKIAAAKLLIEDRNQDLSDVLEKLLSSWVRKQSASA